MQQYYTKIKILVNWIMREVEGWKCWNYLMWRLDLEMIKSIFVRKCHMLARKW